MPERWVYAQQVVETDPEALARRFCRGASAAVATELGSPQEFQATAPEWRRGCWRLALSWRPDQGRPDQGRPVVGFEGELELAATAGGGAALLTLAGRLWAPEGAADPGAALRSGERLTGELLRALERRFAHPGGGAPHRRARRPETLTGWSRGAVFTTDRRRTWRVHGAGPGG